ncbi:hypothetical protein MKW92_004864 [Papaver armeniacum]|nr:hypothetical protein MKW92_004864 [Papaver armeniacum]
MHTRNGGEIGVNEHRFDSEQQGTSESGNDVSVRRVLRSQYLALRNKIHSKINLIVFTLTTSVKAQNCDGVTPNDFITCMLQKFGKRNGGVCGDQVGLSIGWKDLGLEVCDIFMKVPGCCKQNQRKTVTQRKRARKPTTTERPICLDDAKEEQTTGTDKKMITMYNTLRKSKEVRADKLILVRDSFGQTVENLLALSFLVKDGRVKIGAGNLVSNSNIWTNMAYQVASGDAAHSQFVFRLDYKDWKVFHIVFDI